MAEASRTINSSLYCSSQSGSQSAAEGPEREKRKKLPQPGYYSWQEKIMNGHSFSLFLSLWPHKSNICGWKQSSKAPWIVFLFTFQRGKAENRNSLTSNRQNIYAWCSWLRQPRQTDQHAAMCVISQILHTLSDLKQCLKHSEAERCLQTRSRGQQHTSQEISIRGGGSQRRIWVLHKTQIWMRGNDCEACGNRKVKVWKSWFSQKRTCMEWNYFRNGHKCVDMIYKCVQRFVHDFGRSQMRFPIHTQMSNKCTHHNLNKY